MKLYPDCKLCRDICNCRCMQKETPAPAPSAMPELSDVMERLLNAVDQEPRT